eukprot:TRINITY_DN5031_c0_g1_i10.p1 TRINITY_DN5031_c0_g1~~TRINITY_DN5031_c0_g1_i10.p1  ORF type:complete len:184 (+),score=48.84 TRINITY_DN5031_c0_g1_i10:87-638(+)
MIDMNQLKLILDVVGSPSAEEINNYQEPQTRDFLKGLKKTKPKPLETLFKGASPLALDLLAKLLRFDASKRITAEEALAHPYLKELHNSAEELTATPVTLFDFEFEKYSLTGEEFKSLIYDEIQLYHSEEKRKEYERLKKEFPNGILATKGIGKLRKPKNPKKKASTPKLQSKDEQRLSSDSD